MIFSTALYIFLLAAGAVAVPITSQSLIALRPNITSPKADVAWRMGSTHNVTWDISKIPNENCNMTGLILLGFQGNGTSENLNIAHPLASGFPICAGTALVKVPHVPVRDNYCVVLFGDSGNTSPNFKITQA